MKVLNYFVAFVKQYPDYTNVQLWPLLVKEFGKDYWGMSEQDWIKLIDQYRFDKSYQEEIDKVAEKKDKQ